ncbi:MAG: TerB family tellurite resistance protein [Planctomycetota bacterium]
MKLSPAERMNLMKFVCSFVWTDLNVSQAERDVVMRICGQLQLNEAEMKHVSGWLEVPPTAEELDPNDVPPEHRQIFLTTAEMVVKADGKVVPAESESLKLFRDLLSGD